MLARPVRRALALCAVPLIASCSGGMPADVSTGEMFVEISDALNAIRQENAVMQAQIDSLREVVARQDSAIARIAVANGTMPR